MNKIILDTHIKSNVWQNIPNIKQKINNIVEKLAKKSPFKEFTKKCEVEISISLTNEKQIRKINKNHRNKDKSTNVLSFPAFDLKQKLDPNALAKTHDYIFLGDIIISLENIRKEVLDSDSKTFESHLTHLILHSMLHLIGYDHIKNDDAKKMEKLEIEILKSLNIQNPYDNN